MKNVLASLHGGALEGPIPIARLVGKLVTVRPGERAQVLLTLSILAGGTDVATAIAREIDLALDAMPKEALGLASHLAAALQTSGEDRATIARALQKMGAMLTDAIGAPIPASTLLDATVLAAVRMVATSWGPEALLAGKRARAEELGRRVLEAVRVSVETKEGVETVEASRARLLALDARAETRKSRVKEIETALRASLPVP
jgi:hypothetical protein